MYDITGFMKANTLDKSKLYMRKGEGEGWREFLGIIFKKTSIKF